MQKIWKESAGPLYGELTQSKESALALLSHADATIRRTAVYVCLFHWKCSTDSEFVNACRKLGASDSDVTVRDAALMALGTALRSSQDMDNSQFLANLVKDDTNSQKVRLAAYWALREVQFGFTEEDSAKRGVVMAKELFTKAREKGVSRQQLLAMGINEEQTKSALLCSGLYPESAWDSAEQIDWDFVNQYASQ